MAATMGSIGPKKLRGKKQSPKTLFMLPKHDRTGQLILHRTFPEEENPDGAADHRQHHGHCKMP